MSSSSVAAANEEVKRVLDDKGKKPGNRHMDHGYYQVLPNVLVDMVASNVGVNTVWLILLQSFWFLAILNGSMWPHVDPAPFAKVFSAKLGIYQKRESFVPQKFPAIRYKQAKHGLVPCPHPLEILNFTPLDIWWILGWNSKISTTYQCSQTQINIGLTAATPATPTPMAWYKGIRDPRD